MKNFSIYLQNLIHLTSEELAAIEHCAEQRTLKKGEVLVREKSLFTKEVFIEKGVIRAFLIDEEGNEKSTAFFQEMNFMSTSTWRSRKGRSIYSYQALGTCSLVLFDAEEFKSILSKSKKLISLGKLLKEKEIDRINLRDECLLQVKALDKYTKFRTCYPGIENSISHLHIASYLGITPVSLSRIRKRMKETEAINN